MDALHVELWRKICAFEIDNPSDAFTAADMMLVTALFGLAATTHPQMKLLQGALKPISPSDGGIAGSSGGCGGGCGGGGGGCGGCGGGDCGG